MKVHNKLPINQTKIVITNTEQDRALNQRENLYSPRGAKDVVYDAHSNSLTLTHTQNKNYYILKL